MCMTEDIVYKNLTEYGHKFNFSHFTPFNYLILKSAKIIIAFIFNIKSSSKTFISRSQIKKLFN